MNEKGCVFRNTWQLSFILRESDFCLMQDRGDK